MGHATVSGLLAFEVLRMGVMTMSWTPTMAHTAGVFVKDAEKLFIAKFRRMKLMDIEPPHRSRLRKCYQNGGQRQADANPSFAKNLKCTGR